MHRWQDLASPFLGSKFLPPSAFRRSFPSYQLPQENSECIPHTNSARTQPEWAVYLQENRGMAIMGFFMGNIIVGSLVQTGAFEIYLGPDLMHSKIATGVLPDINWLIREVNLRV